MGKKRFTAITMARAACVCLCFASVGGAATYTPQASNRVNINLDTGWLFSASDNSSYSSPATSDASFSKVCLPHANVITKHLYQSPDAFRFISWYRRHFNPPASYSGRRFLLEFQAVSQVAAVYVNGTQVDANGPAAGLAHQGAYTPFTIDITADVTLGQDNVIAVQVDSKQHTEMPPEGRSDMDFMVYGGIVRHVNLIVADPLHVDWVFVSTQNPSQAAPNNLTVSAKTLIVNNSASQKSCTVITSIVDAGNNVAATASSPATVPANGSVTVSQTTSAVSNPTLWSVDRPYLYTVYTQVQDGSTYVDEYATRTGIRSLTVSKTDGKCYLNGQAIKLRGLNRHETFPYIGRAAAKRLQRKDADILKYDLGCNMIRTSHYIQAPDFLDRCDEVGMLVLEEIPGWNYLGNASWKALEMQNLVDMVVRDRNHPCMLTWGCRVNESSDDTWYQSTNDSARFYDPTRLTCGVRNGNGEAASYFYEDIWTRNFTDPNDSPTHVPFLTTEFGGHTIIPQAHSWDDDNILVNQITNSSDGHARGQNENYSFPGWAGLLGWCAFDYASPHGNATTNETGRGNMGYVSHHGVSSVFRLPKLAAYFYQSQRDPALYGPMVHICNYWTSSSPTDIFVVSNCDQVELYQDNALISKKSGTLYTSLLHPCFQWTGVSFKSGVLKAIGYINNAAAAKDSVKTPGSPTGLTIVPDTNVIYEGGDMTRVVVSMIDAFGQVLHMHADSVTLSASGAGADFIGEARTALEGGQMAFYVKTRASQTGTITCQAGSAGLSASATITVIKDPGGGTGIQSDRVVNLGAAASAKTWHCVFAGERFTLPSWAGKESLISIYDISGKLLYRNTAYRSIDFTKFGLAKKVHIVRIAKLFP
jgi:beta-galactosidase